MENTLEFWLIQIFQKVASKLVKQTGSCIPILKITHEIDYLRKFQLVERRVEGRSFVIFYHGQYCLVFFNVPFVPCEMVQIRMYEEKIRVLIFLIFCFEKIP